MGDTSTKTKADMLLELESIKGLLLEEDDIPILQEVEDATSLIAEPVDLEPVNTEVFNRTAFGGDVKNQQATNLGALLKESFLQQDAIPETFKMESLFEKENDQNNTIYNKEIETPNAVTRVIVEEQQDFFDVPVLSSRTQHLETQHHEPQATDSEKDLLNTIDELEKHTAEVTANKFAQDAHRANQRPSLAKATGENPFLPAHIRSRLHGNNPPPLFAQETAKKIASSSVPSRLLGNTYNNAAPITKTSGLRNALIDSVIEKFMPEIEKELREKLQTLTKEQLEDLTGFNH